MEGGGENEVKAALFGAPGLSLLIGIGIGAAPPPPLPSPSSAANGDSPSSGIIGLPVRSGPSQKSTSRASDFLDVS